MKSGNGFTPRQKRIEAEKTLAVYERSLNCYRGERATLKTELFRLTREHLEEIGEGTLSLEVRAEIRKLRDRISELDNLIEEASMAILPEAKDRLRTARSAEVEKGKLADLPLKGVIRINGRRTRHLTKEGWTIGVELEAERGDGSLETFLMPLAEFRKNKNKLPEGVELNQFGDL